MEDPSMNITDVPRTSDSEEIGNQLFKMAMKGKWTEVVKKYQEYIEEDPWSLVAEITLVKDTILHLAAADGLEDTVRQLIEIICDSHPVPEALLGVKNQIGNTPLHFAAMIGNEDMCRRIAHVDFALIGVRNDEGETPLFTAVQFGKKEAFLCLYDLYEFDKSDIRCFKNKHGDTILHCAISKENFDLALLILKLCGEVLANSFNRNGLTPLHVLAEQPSAFKSGSLIFLRFYKRIIYECLPMEVEPPSWNPNYPENYRTCVNFFRFLWTFLTIPILWTFLTIPAVVGIRKKDAVHLDHEEKLESQSGNPAIIEKDGAKANDGHNPERQSRNPERGTNGCFYKILTLAKRAILGFCLGFPMISTIYEEKKRHSLSIQIMNELLKGDHMNKYYHHTGTKPSETNLDPAKPGEDGETNPYSIVTDTSNSSEAENVEEDKSTVCPQTAQTQQFIKALLRICQHALGNTKEEKTSPDYETPILIAARNGISEIVNKILEEIPIAIHDVNAENKNVLLLAVQNRQPEIIKIVLKQKIAIRDRVLRVVDKEGNSALHLAARVGAYKPWLIPGEALQMQWEIKWFQYLRDNIPSESLPRENNAGKTPEELFIENHEKLVKAGGEWLIKTSESYSVVAALIATVAFATSTAVPGGINESLGTPTFENRAPFHLFAISSLIALCLSVTALVTFLSILTSRNKERDFGKDLPLKLLVGLTSLFFSIAAVLISFCSGHFFVIEGKLKYVAYPVYAATCLPVTFFAAMQFPLYFDVIHSTFTKEPGRSYKPVV